MALVVSRAAIEREVARRRDIRDHAFGRWVAARLGTTLLAFYAVAVVVALLARAPALRQMRGWNLTVFLLVPAFMALFVTFAAERLMLSDASLDADRLASRVSREVASLTGPGWPLRTLRAALVLALCAGVPLAVVVLVTGRPAVIARASDAAIAVFISAVVLSSVAIAFAIRTATLHVYRNLLCDAQAGAERRTGQHVI